MMTENDIPELLARIERLERTIVRLAEVVAGREMVVGISALRPTEERLEEAPRCSTWMWRTAVRKVVKELL